MHYYPNSKSILHSLNNLDFKYLSSFFFILLSLRYKHLPKLNLNLGYQPSFLFIINGTILRTIYLTQIYFVCSAIRQTLLYFRYFKNNKYKIFQCRKFLGVLWTFPTNHWIYISGKIKNKVYNIHSNFKRIYSLF